MTVHTDKQNLIGKLHRLTAEYVIEDVLPLSTIESPAFRKLIEVYLQFKYQIENHSHYA